ncbi:MAG: hypothetical protein UW92_C0015G0008 [Candidatus Jorgensenbacteria bacterium GW2011_GWA2_45_13]|uniref:Uncharacterized protein n=1 Tax=Candidatus Jorgensenbacteria bacterium GW2011_GWA2_45_13 TaxID=1618662 RepID=A0A0G1L646_9BACT|nr:MAG: hypothetical protein UW92_C0015G0008 [Candidatus Jorgensenbacteria bacterium GW2011_GWA2_45_13]
MPPSTIQKNISQRMYQQVVSEVGKQKNHFVFKRDEKISIIQGDLLNKVLECFPPHLDPQKAQVPLSTIFTSFFHKPTNSLVVVNKGASLLSKSIVSGRYMIIRHVGFVVYLPNQGIEIIDVGIAGNIQKSSFVVLRPESACSPGFMFGSQRCNCYDQWLLTQELAAEYNMIEKPALSPQKLEEFLTSGMSLDEHDNLISRTSGQAFMMIHFTSQNGMGSGVIENNFVHDLTANAFIRHRGEYSAEQTYNTSVAGGFKTLGLMPDPRKLNDGLSFKLSSTIADYFNAPKNIALLTNNVDKLNALRSSGYKVKRLQLVVRAGDGGNIENDDRRNEFGHMIPDGIKVSWQEEFIRLKGEIDSLKSEDFS